MTKIYRSLKVPEWDATEDEKRKANEAWDEARMLFVRFKNTVDQWTYKVLLPHLKMDKETYDEKKIRSSMWTALMKISSLFPTQYDYKTQSHDERNWGEFARKRETWIKAYQTAFTKAFKDIEEYLNLSGGAVERPASEDVFEIAGMTVIVHNAGSADYDTGDLDQYLRELHRFAGPVRKSGFGKALDGLKVNFSFDQKGLIAGTYEATKDVLTVFPLGLDENDHSTLTHEIGHRFWYRALPSQARAHWTEVMDSRSVEITKPDIDKFFRIVDRKKDPDDRYLTEREIQRLVLPEAEGEAEEAKFKEMSSAPTTKFDDKVYDPTAYRDRLVDFYDGQKIQLEEISEYANTNAVEAFAECFMLWVTKGPGRLGPFVRQLFKETCFAGGARISSIDTQRWKVVLTV